MSDIETQRKVLNKAQTRLRELMTDKEHPEQASEPFLNHHAMLHSAKMADAGLWSFENAILDDMDEARIRRIPHGSKSSITWCFWHIARIEDVAMNRLVADQAQIFLQNNWQKRMQTSFVDTGNAMSAEEMVQLSEEMDIAALRAYPEHGGGGAKAVAQLVLNVTRVFYVPFGVDVPRAAREKLRQFVASARLLPRLFSAARTVMSKADDVALPVGLVARLVLDSDVFAAQLVECVDENAASRAFFSALLSLQQPLEVVMDAVAVVSRLARRSAAAYSFLERVAAIPALAVLVREHAADCVRAKTCNALGNAFRHSAHFYGAFAASVGGIPALLACLESADPLTRKCAAFAVGNLAFHSAAAHADLAPGVAALARLLAPAQDAKTRGNATGALANLMRHSGAMSSALVNGGALQALADAAARADGVKGAGSGPRALALFALGSCAKHAVCRRWLAARGVRAIGERARDNPALRGTAAAQYARRLCKKMAG